MLCDRCMLIETRLHRRYQERGSLWYPIYTHQPQLENDTPSIESSALVGCYFCCQFWNNLSTQQRAVVLSPEFCGIIVSLYWNAKETRFTLLQYITGVEFDECDGVMTDTFDLLPMPSKKYLPSSKTSNIVRHWLEQCIKEHGTCTIGPADWLPTRLVDVDASPPRLILTQDCTLPDLRYVTLSDHLLCEGTTFLATTNVEKFQQGITISDTSTPTHLAIQTTKALKFRYLWTEELCVMQDSTEDKAREYLDMGHIHANSWITITATFPGCLRKTTCDVEKEKQKRPLKLTLLHDRAFGCSPEEYVAIPGDVWTSELFDSRIARSSTHFAKEHSMRRNLHFGKSQLYWKCQHIRACETFPNGDPRGIPGSLAEDTIELITMRSKSKSSTNEELWRRSIEKYTRRSFEDPGSRLSRISCVAEQSASMHGRAYLAGLWLETLVCDLLWYVGEGPSSRQNNYCAPSWSWASVTGAITYVPSSELTGTCFIKIKDAYVNLDDHDSPTSSVAGGYIRLDGYLVEIAKPTFANIRGHHVAGCFYPDDPNDINEDSYFCLPVRKQLTTQGVISGCVAWS